MKKLKRPERRTIKVMLAWFSALAALGATASLITLAASNTIIEPENGTPGPGVSVLPDDSASGNGAVTFKPGCPSASCMPKGTVVSGGHTWTQIVAEDFTKDAVTGSWGSACTKKVVYTGASGTGWNSYPTCYKDTYQDRPYRADKVLSVHDGTLDFWLHNVDGIPAGANISPELPNGTGYQTYGRYEARLKTTTANLSDYYQAWLLWPNTDANGRCAESDFPESQLGSATIGFFSHYCAVPDDGIRHQSGTSGIAADRTQWHTYTQEWMPGRRNYYVDGVLKGTATTNIWDQPMRWQMQNETKSTCDQVTPITCNQDGHMLVDWATVYSY